MIDLALLRDLLGLAADEPSDDVLESLLRRAVARAESITGRYFGPLAEVTEIVRGTHCYAWTYARRRDCLTDRLDLWNIPAATVGEVDPEDPEAEPASAIVVTVEFGTVGAELEELLDFVVRIDGVEAYLLRTDGALWDARQEYHITYTRGYAEAEAPEDVQDFVLGWISRKLATMGSDGLAGEGIGGYSYTIARDQSSGTEELESSIARWKRPVLA
jgi:hypothetical protein